MSITSTNNLVRWKNKYPHHLFVNIGSFASVKNSCSGDTKICLITEIDTWQTTVYSHAQNEEPLQLPITMQCNLISHRTLVSSYRIYKYRHASFSHKPSHKLETRKRADERSMKYIEFDAEAEGPPQKFDQQ